MPRPRTRAGRLRAPQSGVRAPASCARCDAAAPSSRSVCRAILARVIASDALRDELLSTWLREIPLAAAIGVEITACTASELVVRAPLAPNRNLHGTAFAGSLYSVCALTGWGTAWLAVRRAGLSARIVVAESTIAYRKAVPGEIVCRCVLAEADASAAIGRLGAAGRATLPLVCTIDAGDKPAVRFEGTYAIHARDR
jgi:thioesterase domain-containing protein